jgi:hypothetical protein
VFVRDGGRRTGVRDRGPGAGRRREAEESRQQAGGRRKERVWRVKRDGWPGKRQSPQGSRGVFSKV